MNSGFGARILGRSRATAQSCAITATPPPIAAGLPPSIVATTTNPTPRAASNPSAFMVAPPYRPLPPFTALTLRVLLHPIVDAHEPREPTDESADDGEQRLCVHPPIEKPATCPKQQDRDREVERQPEVLVALAVALGLGTGVFLRGSHVAPGNLDACEIFRKQTVKKPTI